MINIPMKTKGPLSQSSLTTLNIPNPKSVLTAQNIVTLNQQSIQSKAPVTANRSPVSASAAANRSPAPAPVRQTTPSRASAPVSVPVQKQLPVLTKPVQKGQKAALSPAGTISEIQACFGWNTTNAQCDVDVSAFLLNSNGKVPGDSWFVFYGQMLSPDRSTRFHAANTTDREMISIDFTKLNPDVKKIVFVLTINDALTKKLHFGMLKDAYIRILDKHHTELVSFKMTDYYSNVISMMIGEVYQYNGIWKFSAVGNGVAKDLAGLCALYGVQVSE